MQKAIFVQDTTKVLNDHLENGWEVLKIETSKPSFGGNSSRSDAGLFLVILEKK